MQSYFGAFNFGKSKLQFQHWCRVVAGGGGVRADLQGPKKPCIRWGCPRWHNLANTIERYVCRGNGALCQIIQTACSSSTQHVKFKSRALKIKSKTSLLVVQFAVHRANKAGDRQYFSRAKTAVCRSGDAFPPSPSSASTTGNDVVVNRRRGFISQRCFVSRHRYPRIRSLYGASCWDHWQAASILRLYMMPVDERRKIATVILHWHDRPIRDTVKPL